jgi:phosphomannomutase/phosphoglucomutase
MDVFGSSGARGVANEDLTPEFACRVARAAAAVLDADRMLVARDTRTSGPMLAAAAASGAASAGADVSRLGVLPTPGLQSHAEREGVPGVVVTASHNPPRDNGLKLVGTDGVELSVGDYQRVAAALDAGAAHAAWDAVGRPRRVDGAAEAYVEDVLAAVDRDPIAAADLRVAVDPGHGAGAHTAPEFVRRLGCSVVTVNAQADGTFPGRESEPVPENLGDLCSLVRAADADVGVAHDGDADRAVFVDETGTVVPPESSFAALAADALSPGDVTVSAVTASQRLVDAVEDAGARLELTPVGSAHIFSRVRELRAAGESVPVVGEGNGGVAFPPFRLARDGAYHAARFLALVAERPASEVAAAHGDYHSVRESLRYRDEAERDRLVASARRVAEDSDADVTTVDGYRLDFDDGWVLARPSGTEPLVRVYAEARDPERARELRDVMADPLRAEVES